MASDIAKTQDKDTGYRYSDCASCFVHCAVQIDNETSLDHHKVRILKCVTG